MSIIKVAPYVLGVTLGVPGAPEPKMYPRSWYFLVTPITECGVTRFLFTYWYNVDTKYVDNYFYDAVVNNLRIMQPKCPKQKLVNFVLNFILFFEMTRKYPLRGCLLGPPGWPEGNFFWGGGHTDADVASGANKV